MSIELWCSRSKCRHAIALLICGIVAFGSAQADSISGRVVAVADGDTVTLQDAEYHLHRIRVAGIDAPEKKQDFGDLSKLSLAALVFNQDVDVVGDKMDRYGRRVGKIMVADPGCAFPPCPKTLDTGLVQIKNGMAWWYRQYAKEQSFEDRAAYEQAEVEARLQLRGLWIASTPAPPWEWRNNRRQRRRLNIDYLTPRRSALAALRGWHASKAVVYQRFQAEGRGRKLSTINNAAPTVMAESATLNAQKCQPAQWKSRKSITWP